MVQMVKGSILHHHIGSYQRCRWGDLHFSLQPKEKTERDRKEQPLVWEIIAKQIRKTSLGSMFNTEPKKIGEKKSNFCSFKSS